MEQTIPNKPLSLEDALDLIKKTAKAKFDESIEVHFRLGTNPKKGDQQVRGTAVLPHGTGKSKRVAVFAEGEKAKEAQEAGADLTGGQELINQIKTSGKCDFDTTVAVPEMMKNLAPIAKILGPKGLMPSPKEGSVTLDIKKTVEAIKKGKVSFRNDDSGNLHQIIGKVSFPKEKLIENYQILLEAVQKAKPAAAKGIYIKSIVLCSSMGKAVKVQI